MNSSERANITWSETVIGINETLKHGEPQKNVIPTVKTFDARVELLVELINTDK